MAEAHDAAAALVGALREQAPVADIVTAGSLRRGCETCGDPDILAAAPRPSSGTPSPMDALAQYRLVERVLAHGDTKSSVRLWGGFQADLRLVPPESFERLDGFTLLAGIECDIRPDGSMDLADDCLAALDIVIASIHSGFNQDAPAMTDRLLRAIACPWVDILGHPTGRILLKREPHTGDMTRVVEAAAAAGVAMEINAQIDRLDLDDAQARRARDAGVRLVVSTDAHRTAALSGLRWGVTVARRAWLTPADVLNTRSVEELRGSLRRRS